MMHSLINLRGHEKVCHKTILMVKGWLTLMKNLAEALMFLHRKSIVHRDLKSDNVVFNKQNDVISFILVDFGKSNHVTKVRRYNLTVKKRKSTVMIINIFLRI